MTNILKRLANKILGSNRSKESQPISSNNHTEKAQAEMADDRYAQRCAMAFLILEVIKADGVFSEEEDTWFDYLFEERLGFSEADLPQVKINLTNGQMMIDAINTFTLWEKRFVLGLCWFIARADGVIEEREHQLISNLCIRLGLGPADFSLLQELLKEHDLDSFSWKIWQVIIKSAEGV